MPAGGGGVAAAAFEFSEGCKVKGVGGEPIALRYGGDFCEATRGPCVLGDSDGPVEGDDRGWPDREQDVV